MNPYEILDVGPEADTEAVRAAYLAAVRRHPPDRDPDAFRRIRSAYDVLADPVRRAEIALFGLDEIATLRDLARSLSPERRRVGPDPWLDVLSA